MGKLHQKLTRVANDLFECAGHHKHFTFICERKKIISVGWNKPFKSHTLAKKFGYRFSSIHSELDAINNFPYPVADLRNYDIINVRLYADRSLALSCPCSRCSKLLAAFGVKNIVFSTPINFERIEI
jgi:deoxycytidylate deaminase